MKKFLCSSIFAIIGLTNYANAQSWTLREPMPTPRYFPCAVLGVGQDANIYVMGGVSATEEIISTNEAYNILSNSWQTLAPMPTPRMEFFTAYVGKKIYAIGGFNFIAPPLNVVEIYDPETDTWSEGTPMPTSRSQTAGGVVNGKIYLTGGWPSSFAALEIYDPETDSWTSGASAPVGIHHYSNGVAYNNKIYTFGGANYGSSIIYNNTYMYDPELNVWSEKSPMPEGRFAGAASVYKGKVHYFGGSAAEGRTHTFDNHYVYDPIDDSWSHGLLMEENRGNMVAVTASDGVYVIGGYMRCPSCDNVTGLNKRYSEEEEEEEDPSTSLDVEALLKSNVIYPNPATNEINITMRNDLSTKSILLTDISGKTLFNTTTTDDKVSIDTAQMPTGLYILTINTSKGSSSQKVSIIRQ